MTAKTTELLEQFQILPEHDQKAFTALFHQWEAAHTAGLVLATSNDQVAWLDFLSRLREQWLGSTPGKPLSEIVSAGRRSHP